MKPHVSIMISTALKDSASLCRIFKNKDWKELTLDSRSSLKSASIDELWTSNHFNLDAREECGLGCSEEGGKL
jgi:hypothetical protein